MALRTTLDGDYFHITVNNQKASLHKNQGYAYKDGHITVNNGEVLACTEKEFNTIMRRFHRAFGTRYRMGAAHFFWGCSATILGTFAIIATMLVAFEPPNGFSAVSAPAEGYPPIPTQPEYTYTTPTGIEPVMADNERPDTTPPQPAFPFSAR